MKRTLITSLLISLLFLNTGIVKATPFIRNFTAKEYEAIGKLILESLTEGPCRGVADGELLLPKFIGKAKEFRADPEVFEQISDAADEYGLSPEMKEAAKRLAGFIP